MALTKRRQLFVLEYVADPKCNATQAAIRAGYGEARAKVTGSELLRDPEIKAAIEHRRNKRFENLEELDVNEKLVLTELCAIRDRAIEAGSGAWQMQTRLRVTELMGRYLKMWTEKVELGLDQQLMELLTAGRKRVGLLPAKEKAE